MSISTNLQRSLSGRASAALVGAVLLSGAGTTVAAGPARADTAPIGVSYSYSGAPQQWVVPQGVTSASFLLTGGAGGNYAGGSPATDGGRNGLLSASLAVVPGETFWFVIGGAGDASGGGGYNGGGTGAAGSAGGGGATDVRRGGQGLAERVLVAGGGGGDSAKLQIGIPARGGRGSGGAPGGSGGSIVGGGHGGGGGTAGAGGAGGRFSIVDATGTVQVVPAFTGQPGTVAVGGAGTAGRGTGRGGGGGGGGWFGGGGGAGSGDDRFGGGAGGGGSGYAAPEASVLTVGTTSFNRPGAIVVTYVVGDPSPEPEEPSGAGATAPTISGAPDGGAVGAAYSFSFALTGAPAPTCAVSSGQLPAGLGLDATSCTISGTPTAGGTSPMTVTASNGTQPDASVDATLTVTEPPSLPGGLELTGTVGQPFSYQLPIGGWPAPTTAWVGPDELPPGLTLGEHGLISGIPTDIAWRSAVGIDVVNSSGQFSRAIGIFVSGTPAVFTSGAPGDVTFAQPYSFQFTATGFPAPVFDLMSGQLPLGLTLDGDTGVLSGTAEELGSFPIVVAARSSGAEATQSHTLRVLGAAPRIHDVPPAATVNNNYRFAFDTTGSNPAPTFTQVSGTLPTGLTIDSNGVISGYPSEITAGSPVTVRAANGTAPDAELTFTLPVNGVPPGITGTPPTGVALGSDYYFGYRLTGTPTPTTTVTAGGLPGGVTLTDNGYLRGVPTTPGSFTFTVTASVGTGPAASITSTVEVLGPQVAITGTPPVGGVQEPYSFAFGTSGIPTVTRSAGALPPGLTLSTSGRLTGTPTTAGTFAFTVRAVNGTRSAEHAVSLVIRPLPTISICGGAVSEGNSGTRSLTLHVSLSRASTVPVTVRWATANGTATAGSDYVAATGTATFAPGQTVRTVSVLVKGDRTRERHEGFVVRLSAPTHATLAHSTGLAGIVNDD